MMGKQTRLKVGILSLLMVLSLPIGAFAQSASNVTILIDGNKLKTDTKARILNSRTVVPYNALFTALGAKVQWDPNTSTVTAVKGDSTIVMAIGQEVAFVNNQPMKMDVAPRIINSRTMVPFSFFLGTLGYNSSWDAKTYTVKISTGDNSAAAPGVVAPAAPAPTADPAPTAAPAPTAPAVAPTGKAPEKDTGTPSNEFTGTFAMQNLAGKKYIVQIRSDNTYYIRNLETGAAGNGNYAVNSAQVTFTGSDLTGTYTPEKITTGRTFFLMKGATENDAFAITPISYEDFAAQY